jgi:6-pyruvoyltetrahydropterin/6-carboxytetrahydropterin synthase
MKVTKEFTFDSAHKLINYKGKCENLHGHTYKLHVTVDGDIKDNGLVIDFVILKEIVNDKIIEKLDHKYLNDFFENPTAEVMAKWIWDELKEIEEKGVKLFEIKLWESPTSFVTYNGE